jgi:outer membrane protein
MKNFTIGLNAVLVIAVAVLFYLHFSKNSTSHTNNTTSATAAAPGSCKIAYIEMDSVQNQFNYYKEVKNELVVKEQSLSRELDEKKRRFAARYQEIQKKGQNMTQQEVASYQQELQDMEREYKMAEQNANQKLQDESLRNLQDVKNKIEDYLKQYNKSKGYSFIFANYSNQDMMYYKDTLFNITSDVIKGLNESVKKKN